MTLRSMKLVFAIALLAITSTASAAITLTDCRTGAVTKNLPCEITLSATANPPNAYTGLSVKGTFTHVATGKQYLNVLGFYDGQVSGKPSFKIRFNPQLDGQWNWSATPTPADAGLTASGTFNAAASNQRGFLRRSNDFPEDPVFDNNDRIFVWGMTYYQIVNTSLATGPNGFWKSTIDTININHSINKVRLLVFPWWSDYSGQFQVSSNPPTYAFIDSVPFFQKATCAGDPRTCLNHDSLRVDHFKALDDVVNHLRTRNMIAELLIFKDHAVQMGVVEPIDGRRTYGTLPQDQKYARYVLARYAAFPNVTWCLTNEWNAAKMTLPKSYWETDIGVNVVRPGDPYFVSPTGLVRFSSIHAKGTNLFEFYNNRATSANNQWATHAVMQYHQNNPQNIPNPEQWGYDGVRGNLSWAQQAGMTMPVANDEYGYLGNVTQQAARQAAWGVAVAGGYGTMGDRRPVPTPNGGTAETSMRADWVAANSGAYNDVKFLITFFSGIPNFFRMRYQDGVIAGSLTRAIAGGEAAVQYIVYDANGGPLSVNLPHPQNAAWTHYTVTPYNPRTGAWGAASTVGFGNGIALPGLGGGDWAYLLTQAP
jgi:Domain of unknown function (DUF5060)/Protein of unknown function (DUF4038)